VISDILADRMRQFDAHGLRRMQQRRKRCPPSLGKAANALFTPSQRNLA
jgi:hypothetical protein